MTQYLFGLFSLANLFIAIFIAIYAFLFLRKTHHQRDRRPWEFLFVSSILFLTFELMSFLHFFGMLTLAGVDIAMLGKIFEFLYSGLVLLAFISQHDLILKSHLIFISKRDEDDEVPAPKPMSKSK